MAMHHVCQSLFISLNFFSLPRHPLPSSFLPNLPAFFTPLFFDKPFLFPSDHDLSDTAAATAGSDTLDKPRNSNHTITFEDPRSPGPHLLLCRQPLPLPVCDIGLSPVVLDEPAPCDPRPDLRRALEPPETEQGLDSIAGCWTTLLVHGSGC